MNPALPKTPDSEKSLRNLGFSVLIQLSFGTIFTTFSIGTLLLIESVKTSNYFTFTFLGVFLAFLLPFIFFFRDPYVGITISESTIESPTLKTFVLTGFGLYLLGEARIGVRLMHFIPWDTLMSLFLGLAPFLFLLMVFYLRKTNLIFEASILVVGVILLLILQQETPMVHLIIFYFLMGVVFLTGGILDFRKFSKLSNSA
jgi:hypothetical protein